MKRFVNADVIPGEISNAITLNRFAYANGNPVSFVDPFGLWSLRDAWNGVKNWVEEKVVEPVSDFGKTVVDAVVDTSERVVEALADAGQAVAEAFVDAKNDIATAVTDTYNGAKQKVKDSVKWGATNVLKPLVDNIQNQLSEKDLTYSKGINLSGSLGLFGINLQGGIALDTEGNIALQGTPGANLTASTGLLSGSISGYQTVTNAPSVENLTKLGYQAGGSASILHLPVVVGADVNVIPDSEKPGVYYNGITTSAGWGTPGAEAHVGAGYTFTLAQCNVFEHFNILYNRILEW